MEFFLLFPSTNSRYVWLSVPTHLLKMSGPIVSELGKKEVGLEAAVKLLFKRLCG